MTTIYISVFVHEGNMVDYGMQNARENTIKKGTNVEL